MSVVAEAEDMIAQGNAMVSAGAEMAKRGAEMAKRGAAMAKRGTDLKLAQMGCGMLEAPADARGSDWVDRVLHLIAEGMDSDAAMASISADDEQTAMAPPPPLPWPRAPTASSADEIARLHDCILKIRKHMNLYFQQAAVLLLQTPACSQTQWGGRVRALAMAHAQAPSFALWNMLLAAARQCHQATQRQLR
jgi:hypothetical protein